MMFPLIRIIKCCSGRNYNLPQPPNPFSSRRRGVFPLLEERVRVRSFEIPQPPTPSPQGEGEYSLSLRRGSG
jgi:hypothetical protein